MRQERFGKSARIPVRVRNGEIQFLYDVELPPLKNGALGELVVNINAVQDSAWREFLTAETSVQIADEGDVIGFQVAVDKGAPEEWMLSQTRNATLTGQHPPQHEGDKPTHLGDGFIVTGHLLEPLFLILRGENLSELRGGKVLIPALSEANKPFEAPSLNQALTSVSQKFEPKRQGHTGNAFRDTFLLRDQTWWLLENVRGQLEAQYEDYRWHVMGLDPRKVRERISNEGGILPDESTRKAPPI